MLLLFHRAFLGENLALSSTLFILLLFRIDGPIDFLFLYRFKVSVDLAADLVCVLAKRLLLHLITDSLSGLGWSFAFLFHNILTFLLWSWHLAFSLRLILWYSIELQFIRANLADFHIDLDAFTSWLGFDLVSSTAHGLSSRVIIYSIIGLA